MLRLRGTARGDGGGRARGVCAEKVIGAAWRALQGAEELGARRARVEHDVVVVERSAATVFLGQWPKAIKPWPSGQGLCLEELHRHHGHQQIVSPRDTNLGRHGGRLGCELAHAAEARRSVPAGEGGGCAHAPCLHKPQRGAVRRARRVHVYRRARAPPVAPTPRGQHLPRGDVLVGHEERALLQREVAHVARPVVGVRVGSGIDEEHLLRRRENFPALRAAAPGTRGVVGEETHHQARRARARDEGVLEGQDLAGLGRPGGVIEVEGARGEHGKARRPVCTCPPSLSHPALPHHLHGGALLNAQVQLRHRVEERLHERARQAILHRRVGE
mmetsp:Transcript_14855/g.45373  ORF Transcript_14855/g.45373 Transcript_14855/m.45373 type:complete len:331 (-) Transcript_14855:2043-3035(-)